MKLLSTTILVFITILGTTTYSDEALTDDQQLQIIEDYMFVTGQLREFPVRVTDDGVLTERPERIKCGMSAIANFVANKDRIDKDFLLATGVTIQTRPQLLSEQTVASPSGQFLIHYTMTGDDAVYQSSVDLNSNGVPDFVDSVAIIFDSVHNHIVNVLGYPAPIGDGFYTDGDDRVDIWLSNLQGGLYGQTWIDSAIAGGQTATAFIELDNDYQSLPDYVNRPLDAVRVTAAHEYFHAVQFAIDWTEAEIYNDNFVARYWMEMSSTWMEEEIYDNINDYYLYLPWFFDDPRASIQQFKSYSDSHPYASAIFPIFVADHMGRDIIRDIWLKCGTMGPGASFLLAAQAVIDSASNGTESWATIFSDFVVANYFTGSRFALAPPGIAHAEGSAYPEFPSSMIPEYFSYPVIQLGNENPLSPRHNGAAYVTFVEPWPAIPYDTSYWKCNNYSGVDCIDSTLLDDTASVYDFIVIDSVFDLYLALGDGANFGIPTLPNPWGTSFIFSFASNVDSVEVLPLFAADDFVTHLGLPNPRQYHSITVAFSPASPVRSMYQAFPYFLKMGVGFFAEDSEFQPDSTKANLPSAVLEPYPNPAVLDNMTNSAVTFRFMVETDSLGFPIYGSPFSGEPPYLEIDLYTIAGERIKTLTAGTVSEFSQFIVRDGLYEIEWDLLNDSNNEVASGVYIAFARLFSNSSKDNLLVKAHTKVAIIR